MRKKLVAMLILAMTGTMFLGGCGSDGGSGSGGDGKSGGKVKIRFASWDEAEDVDAQQAAVDKFNEAHDDIEVTLEAYGGEFDTKISAGMGSNDMPDVMYMWNYPAYSQGLEPLDSYIEKEGEDYKKNFYDTLWNYNSYDGSTYGIPIGFTTHALFYNKDIFAEAGIDEPTNDWTWEDLNTKLIYTVPNFQNPTGRTMTEKRRKQLAELAEKYDVYVLEDNPYGEIRFAGQHVPAVKSFDKSGHVFYMSTFSKTLAPGFRLGWLVADKAVVNKLTVLKQSADLHTDNLAQFAVAQFFADNDVDAHVKEISALYGKRKDLMLEGIKKYFPEGVKYTDPEGGMFLWVEVPGVDDTVELFKECLEHDVAFVPGDPFFAGEVQPGAFRLNYSNMKEDQIEVGLKRLGAALTAAVNK